MIYYIDETWYDETVMKDVWAHVHQTQLGVHILNGAPGWIWNGPRNSSGYGYYTHPDTHRIIGAHRLIYYYSGLNIPEGHDLDHLCRVRNCVQPIHLEPVTRAENLRRRDKAKPLMKQLQAQQKRQSNSGLRSAFHTRTRRRS